MPFLLLFLLFSTVSTSYADIYTYKNSDNQFYFTDKAMDKSYRLLSVYRPKLTTKTNKNYSLKAYKRNKRKYLPLVNKAAKKFQINPNLLHAIVDTESAFNPKAVSRVGAIGLMQLMPKTAKSLKVTDVWNPRQNIQGGAKYFSQLLNMFEQNIRLAIAAYNAGPTAVKKAGNNIPNYSETRKYVAKVMDKYNALK